MRKKMMMMMKEEEEGQCEESSKVVQTGEPSLGVRLAKKFNFFRGRFRC